MKPVVSSIVAIAIALTPAFALAAEKSTHKPVAAKVVKHHKKTAKLEAKADKPAAIAKVHHVIKKDGDKKSALHNVSNVTHEVGHKGEPKVEHGVTVIPASMTMKPKAAQTKPADPQAKPADLPKLPAPAVVKPAHAKEKGARKAAEKKSASDDSSDGGQTERDEDFASLVARIRGQHASAAKPAPKACTKDPVQIARGQEIEAFQLTRCDGSIAPTAVEHLSVLVRPGSAARPTAALADLAKRKGADLARGIRRIDPGLVTRLQAFADHFHKAGAPVKVDIVSGYRPASVGSLHQSGRAMDFHLEGVTNEELVAFCKTLTDTGCGYYPNSSFVHVDVREPGAGHVAWIDASGPGETPRYVASWPPPAEEPKKAQETTVAHETSDASDETAPEKGLENASAKLNVDLPPEPVDEHPSEVTE
jgi:hypothetical protein